MQPDRRPQFNLFDRDAEIVRVDRRLPHWSQAGTVCFVTWRTHDSMPSEVLDRWFDDRARWLLAHDVDPNDAAWQERVKMLDDPIACEFLQRFWNRWHDALDTCAGACALQRPEAAAIVADSLLHFDGQRYQLLDFIVMPNHVHVLAAFAGQDTMLAQCESWKHYTATQINRQLKRRGRFWQADSYDHLVRSETQLVYLRRYIAENPGKANLQAGEFRHYSRELG